MGDIDFDNGGYAGDEIEEYFKPFTKQHMEYWWHFREVLRPALNKHDPIWWTGQGGRPLDDDEYRELIALSMLHYAAFLGIAEALSFQNDLFDDVNHADSLRARRNWKALYSSLYSSFNAICNEVYFVVLLSNAPTVKPDGSLKNTSPLDLIAKLSRDPKHSVLSTALKVVETKMQIRHHLNHFWPLWVGLGNGLFKFDVNFTKGTVPIDPVNEVRFSGDAMTRAADDIAEISAQFNLVYCALSTDGNYLDGYFSKKGWQIDYSDLGHPHNGRRPRP